MLWVCGWLWVELDEWRCIGIISTRFASAEGGPWGRFIGEDGGESLVDAQDVECLDDKEHVVGVIGLNGVF